MRGIYGLLSIVLFVSACGGSAAVQTGRGDSEAPGGTYRRVVDPFPVLRSDGSRFAHPFVGGYNVPRPQFVDIDGDSDVDLFVQEYTGSVAFFENTGTPSHPIFTWRTDKYKGLDVGEWYRFADIDLDADLDLLSELPYSYVRVYRNTGSVTDPAFEVAVDSLRDAHGTPIFSDRQNIPNITDIDCDRLADLFIGRLDGTVSRYEATTGEGVPVFRLVAERFEDIQIVAQFGQPGTVSPMPNIPPNMPGNGPSAPSTETRSARHGANTMTFADTDGDGDQDLFWGDFFEPSLLRIENTGSCSTPSLRGEPRPFPPPNPIMSSGYNAPAFGDVNGDGALDLIVGVLGGAFNPNRTAHANLYFYEQVEGGRFSLRTPRFLDQIDLGSESFPAFADTDGDGDQDLYLANKISAENSRTSVLLFFENTGSVSNPSFAVRDSLNLIPAFHYAPVFDDLDADGDLDMLLGTWNDGIAFYRNAGTKERPEFKLDQEGFVKLTRGSHTTPALADIDADGDKDLFVGETSGTFNFYQNTGTAEAPVFELVSDEYAGIDVGRRSVPTFRDVDNDGDLDLIAGSEAEGLLLFENTGSPETPRFESGIPFFTQVAPVATPAFVDIDGDGREELFVGSVGGGLMFFEDIR